MRALNYTSLFVIIFPFLELRLSSNKHPTQRRRRYFQAATHAIKFNYDNYIPVTQSVWNQRCESSNKQMKFIVIYPQTRRANKQLLCNCTRRVDSANWASRPVTLNNPHKRPNGQLIYCVLWLVAWRGGLSHTPLLSTPWLHAAFIL